MGSGCALNFVIRRTALLLWANSSVQASMHSQPIVVKGKINLKDFSPSYAGGLDKEKTKEDTRSIAHRIGDLQQLLYANSNHSVLLLFQGMDASGKDGAIRSVLEFVNPAGVQVANFKVPSTEESAHDFLWRIHKEVPRYGNIGTFNRSHYESVLAERVLEIVPRKIWSGRYAQIVDWERMLVANNVVILKFFLHLSREEQAERLRERLENPKKNWKFSLSDLDARSRWDDYAEAYEDVLNETSHEAASWHIVPADRNWYRDFVVASAVVNALENLKMKWPKPKVNLSKVRIK
jgi:PPK2 family polyphosphate:nucleotide phosphotransferase